ncbi:MAG: YjbQ family protein [Thermoplasmata archaeon]|nr:MAG: YjbQ family protein [Thermoplasmata archaeon]HEC88990.1 YjbQ family protein [Thermoplasmatales archaeon]
MIETINISSNRRSQLIDITSKVEKIVRETGVEDGFIILYVPHTTAGILINEGADPDVQRDILETLEKLIPRDAGYRHVEGNSDAHIKSTLIGCSTMVLIEKSRLLLGTWQHIFFYEGDGPRNRKVYVKIISTKQIG